MKDFTIWPSLGFTGNPYDNSSLSDTEEGRDLFHGRPNEISALQLSVGSGGVHPAVEGPPGVGKTSLALVASYDMFRRTVAAKDGTLFLPVSERIQFSLDCTEFRRRLWRCIALTLIRNERHILDRGLAAPRLDDLGSWLSSPSYLSSGSAGLLGFSGGAGRSLNTSSGFTEDGFEWLVRCALRDTFPTTGSGAVVCALDNMELLKTSDAALRVLEELRETLFETQGLRVILIGSYGIVSACRTQRLSGFIDRPTRLEPLAVDDILDLVDKRIGYWGVPGCQPPVQPADFRFLYRTLGLNLRDSLSVAQKYSRHFHSMFISHHLPIPDEGDRSLMFKAWLADLARDTYLELPAMDKEAWDIARSVRSAGCYTIDQSHAPPQLANLVTARVVELVRHPSDEGQVLCRLTLNGELALHALSRSDPSATIDLLTSNASFSTEGGGELAEELSECNQNEMHPKSDRWGEHDGDPSAGLVILPGVDGVRAQLKLTGHSPHLLIAGTTGSGKTVFLRSLLCSLALRHSPDDVEMLLIDGKGGAALWALGDLPHVIGVVNYFGDDTTRRGVASLQREFESRRVLSESLSPRSDAPAEVKPRLIIVVDEVSSVSYWAPNLWRTLQAFAGLREYLGIHLILSTQRVLSIGSHALESIDNRIGLRLSDRFESLELLGVPDAGQPEFPATGSAIARLPSGETIRFPAMCLDDDSGGSGITSVARTIALCQEAASERNHKPGASLWPDDLPGQVGLQDVRIEQGRPYSRKVPIGVEIPWGAAGARTCLLDLVSFESLAVLGAPRSGKSTFLRTVGYSACRELPPEQLSLDVIDCGSGSLTAFSKLPHCDLSVSLNDRSGMLDAIESLLAKIEQRRGALRLGRSDELSTQLVLIDNWDTLTSIIQSASERDWLRYNGLVDDLRHAVRTSYEFGVHFVISSLPGRGKLCEDHLLFRMDAHKFRGYLQRPRGISPCDLKPGRAFWVSRDVELQVASLSMPPGLEGDVGAVQQLSRNFPT